MVSKIKINYDQDQISTVTFVHSNIDMPATDVELVNLLTPIHPHATVVFKCQIKEFNTILGQFTGEYFPTLTSEADANYLVRLIDSRLDVCPLLTGDLTLADL